MAFEWLHDAYRQLPDIKPDEVHEALGAEHRRPRLAVYDELQFRVLTVWARTHAGFMDELLVTDEPVPPEAMIPTLSPAEEIVYLDPRDG